MPFSEIAMSSFVTSDAFPSQTYQKEYEKVEFTWTIKDLKNSLELGKVIKSSEFTLKALDQDPTKNADLFLELGIDKSSFTIYLGCSANFWIVFRSVLRIQNFEFEGSQTVGSYFKLFEHSYEYKSAFYMKNVIGSGKIEPIPQEMVICLELSALTPGPE